MIFQGPLHRNMVGSLRGQSYDGYIHALHITLVQVPNTDVRDVVGYVKNVKNDFLLDTNQ
jgi:hypothetical protein